MGSNKETLKKKKPSRVSNTRKRKCWVKPWLTENHKSLYHGLVSELLFHDKEEFRMFLRMNTYEISKFVLISKCVTKWGPGGEASQAKNLVEIFMSYFSILKH